MVQRYILIFLGFYLFFILLVVFVRPIVHRTKLSKQSKRILLFVVILCLFPLAFLIKNYLYEPNITTYVTTSQDGLLVSTRDSVKMVLILDEQDRVKYVKLLENKRIPTPIEYLEDLELKIEILDKIPPDALATESYDKIKGISYPFISYKERHILERKPEEEKEETVKEILLEEMANEENADGDSEEEDTSKEESSEDEEAVKIEQPEEEEPPIDSIKIAALNIKGRVFIDQNIYPLLEYLIELQEIEQAEDQALLETIRIQEESNPNQDLRLLPIVTNPEDYQALIDLFDSFKKKNLVIDKLNIINVIDHLDSSFVLFPALILAYILNTLIAYFLWFGVLLDEEGEPMVPKLIRQFAAVFIYILAISVSIALVFPHVLSGFLTTIGTSGAIAALVAQQPIRQAFTALSLNLNKKIRKGDLIEIDGHVGVVREIGWKSISFITKYSNTLSVPNTTLVNSIYTNYSRPEVNRDIPIEVWTRIGVSPNRVAELLKKCALHSELVTGEPQVSLMEIQSMRAKYVIEVTTPDINSEKVQNEVLSAVWHMMVRENLHPGQKQLKPAIQAPFEKARKLLNNVPILEPFTDNEDAALAESAEWVRYGWPERIVVEGDTDAALYIVAEGNLEILVKQKDGQNLKVATLGKNKLFGEMALLTGEPRKATVRAMDDVLLCKISKEAILPIISREMSILQELSQRLAERQLEIDQKTAAYDQETENNKKESAAKRFLELMNNFLYEEKAAEAQKKKEEEETSEETDKKEVSGEKENKDSSNNQNTDT